MLRRDLLKGGAASLATIAAPRIGRAEKANKLVFVPTEDLNVLDPSGGASLVRPWLRFHTPLIGRVEDGRAGLGRCRATSPVPSTSNALMARCSRDDQFA